MTTYHSAVSLDMLEQWHRGELYLENSKGEGLGKQGCLVAIRQKRRRGYTYWPPCDHVTPDGRCAGHETGE